MRKSWQEEIPKYKPDSLVFLDESGINTDMTRRYGRSKAGSRCVDFAPLGTPITTTVLSSIRTNGETCFTTYRGGTSADTFVDYLKNDLIPTLHRGDTVVMDNMRSHHVDRVRDTLRAAHINLLYLPPYSPDFNPIEKLWSKLKAILRKWKIRIASALPDAIYRAFHLITPENCRNWFHACTCFNLF